MEDGAVPAVTRSVIVPVQAVGRRRLSHNRRYGKASPQQSFHLVPVDARRRFAVRLPASFDHRHLEPRRVT